VAALGGRGVVGEDLVAAAGALEHHRLAALILLQRLVVIHDDLEHGRVVLFQQQVFDSVYSSLAKT